MAAGTGGSPSVTRLSLGVTTPDWASAGRGTRTAMVRSRHDSRGIRAPHSRCGSRKLRRYRYGCEMWGAQHAAPLPIPTGRARRLAPSADRGEGCWLYDEQGKGYLDAVGGAYVANLGHSNPEMAEALARQAREFGYVSATAFTHGPVEELARELAATLPRGLDKLNFLSSGSEAVETALKLAPPYWIEAGKPGKHRIIALNPSHHRNTLLALSASAPQQYKVPFREWLVDV